MFRTIEELSAHEKSELVHVIAQKKAGLIDKDWAEICDEFELSNNAETLRKAGVGVKLVADANLLREENTEAVFDLSDGYIDRQKMRDLRNQVNAMYRSESRSEMLRETVREAVKSLTPITIDCLRTNHGGNRSLVVALGDFHYGADINVTGLYGEQINRYDSKVFESRMAKLLTELVGIVEKENIGNVEVLLVGDLLDGILRQSQLIRLEYGLVESTMKLSEYLANWLAALGQYVGHVRVHACTGNHSEVRPLRSKSREFEDENLERIIMWYLEARLAGCPAVEVNANKTERMVLAEIEGFNFLLLHGDNEKRIEDIAKETVNCYGKQIDFFVCGHKHREEEYPSGMTKDGHSVVIRVPSLCGVDKYAQSNRYNGLPGATAMVIEAGYGRRCVYPIKL